VRLTVHVIHWNSPESLLGTVDRLLASRGVSADVTVLDNGSEREAVERVARGLPAGVRLVRLGRNLGYTGAANLALRETDPAAWCAIAAHDVVAEPGCLERLVDTAARAPEYAALGPSWWTEGFGACLRGPGRWALTRGEWFGPPPGETPPVADADWISGGLLLIRTAAARAIGGFSQKLFAYCEDVDFGLRLRRAGWRVGVVAGARAWESGHTISNTGYAYLIMRNSMRLTLKFGGPGALVARALAGYSLAAKALAGSIAPWRAEGLRLRSRGQAATIFWAVTDALTGGVRRNLLRTNHEL